MTQPSPRPDTPRRARPRAEKVQVSASVRRRRAVAAIAGVVIVGGILAVVLINVIPRLSQDREPLPAVTETGPTPTAAVSPVEPDTSTALLAAVPDTVLRWALTGRQAIDPVSLQETLYPRSAPLEAYELTYSDGAGAGDIALQVSQWREADYARAAMDNVQVGGEVVRDGDVTVGGEVVGHMVAYASEAITPAQLAEPEDLADATATDSAEPAPAPDPRPGSDTVVWTNGTVLFVLHAPGPDALIFYDAFGM